MLQKMPLSFKLEFSLVYTPHSFASQSRGRVRTGTGTDRTVPFEWSVPCFERFTSRVFLWGEPLHVVQLSLSSEVDGIHFRRSALKPRPLQRDFFFFPWGTLHFIDGHTSLWEHRSVVTGEILPVIDRISVLRTSLLAYIRKHHQLLRDRRRSQENLELLGYKGEHITPWLQGRTYNSLVTRENI